jgi:hypothetical protein
MKGIESKERKVNRTGTAVNTPAEINSELQGTMTAIETAEYKDDSTCEPKPLSYLQT